MRGTSKNLTAPRSVKEVCMYDIYSFDRSLSKKDTRKHLFGLTAVCIVKDLDLQLGIK